MMVHPHDPYEGEADAKCEIRGPLAQQLGRQVGVVTWHLDFHDEQRDRDREDATRESFHARRFRSQSGPPLVKSSYPACCEESNWMYTQRTLGFLASSRSFPGARNAT